MSLVYKSLPGSHTGTWGVARALEAGTGCWGFYCLKYLSHFYIKIEKVLVIMEKGAEMTELRRDSLPLGPGPFLGGSPTRVSQRQEENRWTEAAKNLAPRERR